MRGERTKNLGHPHFAWVCAALLIACGDDAAPSTDDGGPRVDLGGRDLGPDPADGFSPSVRCATNEECTPAMNAAPCALTFCDRVNGRCVTTGPDGDADGHADENCDPGLGPTAVRGDDCDDVDPMRFPGRPEMCDALGFDEDCDSRTVGGGRPGDGDADGDGFVSSECTNHDDATGEVLPGPDCDDSNAEIHPRAVDGPPDTCNGVDDNCDGDVDPGCTCSADMPCGPSGVVFGGASVCAMGVQRCSAGTLGMCEGAVYPRAETCEIERLDDDCDGLANETDVCECDDGSTGLCGGAPDGAHNDEPSGCRRGSRTCVGGRWQTCEDAIGPSPESCEGRIDEDCDGTVDEDCGCTDGATRPCGTDTGECTPGTQTCSSGGWGDCSGGIGPMPEVCDIDRRDENCDGNPNEGCACASGENRSCGVETGECIAGTEMCSGGVWGACAGGRGPTAEVCDGDDDDCNGTTDDGCACTNGATRPCGTDIGNCAPGTETCSGGAWGACAGGIGPTLEDCDGGDEDCDNMIDEGCGCTVGASRPCGGGAINGGDAICRIGSQTCQPGGTWGTCAGNVDPRAETCDAALLDEDCDGIRHDGCAANQVSTGKAHACALLSNGHVVCWGANSAGELGIAPPTASSYPIIVGGITDAVEVAAGGAISCARRSTGQVVCWGVARMLGTGSSTDSAVPVAVSGISDAVELALGDTHGCIRRSGGTVSCWGSDSSGQLGNGAAGDSALPTPVSGLTNARSIDVGLVHTCAARTSGDVMCWGSNSVGATGTSGGTSQTPVVVSGLSGVTMVALGFQHSCSREATAIHCWGFALNGALGDPTFSGGFFSAAPRTAAVTISSERIAAGGTHGCAASSSGEIQCWGNNATGQLGDGTITTRTTPANVPGLTATFVSCGDDYTCARSSGGAVWCWGNNASGQLGRGTTGGTGTTPAPVIGFP